MLPGLALVLGGALSGPQGSAAGGDLEEAARRLREPREPSVREGARLCLGRNTKEAMELLLEVLRGPQPHYRDIVWEVTASFTDPYARALVELELRANRRDPRVREWCAELLGEFGDATPSRTLEAALGDEDPGVRREAARALGRLRYAPAAKALQKAARDRDGAMRAIAIEALVRLDPGANRALFLGGLADRDAGVRCALLGALPGLDQGLAEEASGKGLADADWRVRFQAVENLGSIRTKTAVDALLPLVDDGRPVVGKRAVSALQGLTAMKWTLREQWESWWRESRETFVFPQGSSKPPAPDPGETVARYYGLPVESDHVGFLVDKSQAMRANRPDGKGTKEEAALAELDATLARLEGKVLFNVFAYANEVTPFSKKPARLDERSRKAALAFVSRAPCAGSKNIWQALETALEDPTLDTLYLLSSGEPEVGLYVHWNRVTAHLADLNRSRKVVVHTVAYSDNAWYREQLEKIAEVTGGRFVAVD